MRMREGQLAALLSGLPGKMRYEGKGKVISDRPIGPKTGTLVETSTKKVGG